MEVASETMQPVDIYELLGTGIRAARERRGWRQEDAARWFQYYGLPTWRRSTVGEVEAGRRRPSVGDLLLVCLALRVTLADLVPEVDERIDLGAGATAPAAEIRALLSADREAIDNLPIEEIHSVPGDTWLAAAVERSRAKEKQLRPLLRPIYDASPRPLTAGDWQDAHRTPSEAEVRAAGRLAVEPAQLKLASRALWERDFEEERNARAAGAGDLPPATVQARRGHAARAMLAELKDFLNGVFAEVPPGGE
jgi:transcriptional regulator with XRE-family HTH domain